ncbi:hypothetical protein [Paenibacillus albiflavus]|nr:hypothetical protein [Paenibacillus albiflavus]
MRLLQIDIREFWYEVGIADFEVLIWAEWREFVKIADYQVPISAVSISI